jgi:N-acetylneuraminic acid mutarotase
MIVIIVTRLKYIKPVNSSFAMPNLTSFKPFLLGSISMLCVTLSVFSLLNANAAYSITRPSETSHGNESYWTIGKNLSSARNELAAVELNGKIYAMGGEDIAAGGGQKDTVEVYDIKRNEWNVGTVAPMPLPLDHTAAAVYNGKIYLVGGFLERKVPTDKVFIYDPAKNEWRQGKSLPSPIGAALNAKFIDGILYIVGGLNASDLPVNTNYAYDPKTNTWTIKAPMPTARHHLQTAVVNGKLFAIGGRILGDGVPSEDLGTSLSNFDRNEMYDPQTDSWTTRQHMLTKRSGFTASTGSDGNIYVFGGQGLQDDLPSVERYDPRTDSWTYDKSMPTRRYGLNSVGFDDTIYVLGGQLFTHPGRLPLSANEIFHIPTK